MLDIVATERPLILDPRVAVQIIDANKRKLKERMAELEKETETKEECVCGSCLSDGSDSDEVSLD